jgi:predicted Zn finger-like uncharacterized protein
MGFITRCPACATAFKVVPDQLKISEGWVRCGHCQEVFDATLDLQPWWEGAGAGLTDEPPQPNAPEPTPATEPEQPTPQLAAELAQAEKTPLAYEPADAADRDSVPGKEPEEVWPALSPDPDEVHPATWTDAAPGFDRSNDHFHEDEVPLSFVQKAQRDAFWRRASVRWTLVLLCLAAAAILLLQWAWLWRDTLAARVPAAKPVLEGVCSVLGCNIEHPRSLTAVQLESAALWRRNSTDFVFDVVLKNQADHAVVTPALELTLTDATEQVLVRRVVLPQDWPQSTPQLNALQEWPVRFELELQAAEARGMTGYRALLFYP